MPTAFDINDMIAEVYGPTLARRSIFYSIIGQGAFSLCTMLVMHMPYPAWWHGQSAFEMVFGAAWLVFIANMMSEIVGMTLNTQLISKTKIIANGRFFPLRSLCSTAIGEFVQTAIVVIIAILPLQGFHHGITMLANMVLFKLVFSLIAVLPTSFLVSVLKRADNADVYEYDVSFNPLNFFAKRKNSEANVINFNAVQERKKNATQV